MSQGLLPYAYEDDAGTAGATALAGMPVLLDLIVGAGLGSSISRHIANRTEGRGWSDVAVVVSLILLNIAGGDCVDDLKTLGADGGFNRVLRRALQHGLSRRERRELERQLARSGETAVPSASAVFRYMEGFRNIEQEKLRAVGTAFVPEPNGPLRGLGLVNRDLVAFAQRCSPSSVATLDTDATLVETYKESAFYGYKKFRAYQPLNVYWHEQGLMVESEFRDGNVPAAWQNRRVIEQGLAGLPEGVKTVFVRTDTAGYDNDLLRYLAEGKSERFGVIEFAISADVTQAFKGAVAATPEAEWKPLKRDVGCGLVETGQEWAEVVYVPDWAGRSKDSPRYRFLAIREPMQPALPGMDADAQPELPFPTMTLATGARYKVFGVITNRLEMAGDELIWWHRQRCGKSEEAHSIMKEDLAGGQLPSEHFGVNAAWWGIMILAFNLLNLLKRHALPKESSKRRTKALRLTLLNLPGRVIEHARTLLIRLPLDHPAAAILIEARRRIAALLWDPIPAPA